MENKKNQNANYYFNEFKSLGTDYNDPEEIRIYDERMGKLRNIKKEIEDTINIIGLKKGDTLLEIGCGTGEFCIEAAKRCSKIIALDVSKNMLEYAKNKASNREITNISFVNAGFLSYQHEGKPVDLVVSSIALHHLPDFWKLMALKNINSMLKEKGKFYLHDVVFSFDIKNFEKAIECWINQTNDDRMKKNMVNHISEEFSTTNWIMEKIIEHAGFNIESKEYKNVFFASYLCIKN
ncbi:MAG TPA: class I SAM-dependent methyltransferase [Methanofastidiosum sp.]|nr:class I SAM-dependent methyltransferase [Methanofastidiosum sp.]HNU60835.1 class I SAM-dependent methyltransferase [Methanofastidiosum sp.]